MEKVYQVFISSTFSDLEDERKKVGDALAKAGFIPSGMELFPATSLQQLEFIKKVIDRCDYYVVIVGARYGSMVGNKSYTEREYEYALSRKLPVLAFLHKHPGKIASEKTEADPAKLAKFESFRTRLKASRVVYHWTDVHDLCMNVLVGVTSEVTLSPGIGWVRGDQAIDPKILQEIERLRTRNAELEKRLSTIDWEEVRFPPHLPTPDSEFKLRIQSGVSTPSRPKPVALKVSATWSEIFLGVIDSILNEKAETSISNDIARYLLKREEKNLLLPSLNKEDMRQVRFQLEALGLIRAVALQGQRDGGGSYTTTVWQITDKGRRYTSQKLAFQNKKKLSDR